MTSNRFLIFIRSKSKQTFTIQEISDGLLLEPDEVLLYNSTSPIRYHTELEIFMFSLNKNSNGYMLPELILTI